MRRERRVYPCRIPNNFGRHSGMMRFRHVLDSSR